MPLLLRPYLLQKAAITRRSRGRAHQNRNWTSQLITTHNAGNVYRSEKMRLTRIQLLMRKPLWIIYLAVALVFVQSVRLHVHVYDHEPLSSNHSLQTSNHSHHEQAHFHYDAAEVEHSDEVVEIDVSPQGFLKTFSPGSLVLALFTLIVFIFPYRLLPRLPWPPDPRDSRKALLYGLRPPLRAPPL